MKGKERNLLMDLPLSIWPFFRRPFVVLFNVTQRCNLRCSYCFGSYYADQREMTLIQSEQVLSEFYRLGARRLGLGGGEPLLYRDIDALISSSVKRGFGVGLNSNGILVPQHISALKLVDNLSISLDGARPATHDRYRGKGSFDKALAGIECAAQADIPIHLCMTLTAANEGEIQSVLDLAKKFKAWVQISPLYFRLKSGPDDIPLEPLAPENLRAILTDLIQKKKKGENLFFSAETYQLIREWPDDRKDSSPVKMSGHPACVAGKKFVHLDSAGQLYPCARVSDEMSGQDCLALGVEKAYFGLAPNPCRACRWACYLEYNSLLNLTWPALWNFGKVKRRVRIRTKSAASGI